MQRELVTQTNSRSQRYIRSLLCVYSFKLQFDRKRHIDSTIDFRDSASRSTAHVRFHFNFRQRSHNLESRLHEQPQIVSTSFGCMQWIWQGDVSDETKSILRAVRYATSIDTSRNIRPHG